MQTDYINCQFWNLHLAARIAHTAAVWLVCSSVRVSGCALRIVAHGFWGDAVKWRTATGRINRNSKHKQRMRSIPSNVN